MFLGRYEHSIDDKGRLTIPARFRDALIAGAYLMPGFDNNLMVLPAASFEQISAHLELLSVTDQNARYLKRFLYSNAERLEVDKIGRILIPQILRDTYRLNTNVIIVGAGGNFEIWSEDQWKQQSLMFQDMAANSARFAAYNLPLG